MALPIDRAIAPGKFPAKVQKFVSPDSPEPMRMMLARGMVPMKPLVQVCALFQLAVTSNEKIGRQAVLTVKKMPPATLRQICGEPLLPQVLDWLAEIFGDSRDLLRKVLLNKHIDNDTILRVAKIADEETCEMIARNQTRLLAEPKIIEVLYFNRNLRASTSDRIIDFAARSGLTLEIPMFADVVAAIQGETAKSEAEVEAEDAAFRAARDAEAEAERLRQMPAAQRQTAAAKEPEPEVVKKSAAGRIRDLNIAQKMRLAMMGTRTERAILIKDSNKLVARSVIRSPGMSDSEALIHAKNPGLLDEIIMYISHNRKWTRHYRMKMALVCNPKTPTQVAMRFLPLLRLNDLKTVSRSRSARPVIVGQAKKLVKKKMN